MVITDLKHLEEQVVLTPSMQKAIEFLRKNYDQQLVDGHIEVDGEKVFAQAISYQTVVTDQPRFEGSRKVIKLLCLQSGEEVIKWGALERAQVTTPYNPDKDAWFGTMAAEDAISVRFPAGIVAVVYPGDACASRQAVDKPMAVKKIVVKVAL